MPDPDEVRGRWARRVAEEYDGWPAWPAPDAAADARDREPVEDAAPGAAPDESAVRAGSGWSWGVPAADLQDLDAQLVLRQNTGETARALRRERAYWGLDAPDE